MKRDLLDDLKNMKYNIYDSIADLNPYLYNDILYGVSVDSDARLKQHFAAATIKYKNPDKEYEDILDMLDISDFSDEIHNSKEDIIWFNLARAIDMSTAVLSDLDKTLAKPNISVPCGQSFYILSMTRIKESFKSAILLLRNGFFVEVTPIYRLIYEQLCWACFVIEQDDIEKIKANRTTKNTKYLKEKINDAYGKLYDDLSKDSHLAVERLDKYIGVIDGKIATHGRSGLKCKAETDYLILFFKIYTEVLSHAVNKHFTLSNEERVYYNEFLHMQFINCNLLFKVLNGEVNLKICHQNSEGM